jgi:hypothetical protein
VTEAKMLDQEGVVAEQVGSVFRAREWGYWVSLRIVKIMLWNRLVRGAGYTDHVSDDENWGLKLLRGEWRELLNGTNGPSIRLVAGEVAVRTHSQNTVSAAHTQAARWCRLDRGRFGEMGR